MEEEESEEEHMTDLVIISYSSAFKMFGIWRLVAKMLRYRAKWRAGRDVTGMKFSLGGAELKPASVCS